MMMIQYLLDVDEEVKVPDIKSQPTRYKDPITPVKEALAQEERVSSEIFGLFELAREIKDYRAEHFMQWFVKEQVEEVVAKAAKRVVAKKTKTGTRRAVKRA